MGSRIVDLSHPIEAGHRHLPGAARPRDHAAPDPRRPARDGTRPASSSQIDLITLCGNTGTYMDSPFHR